MRGFPGLREVIKKDSLGSTELSYVYIKLSISLGESCVVGSCGKVVLNGFGEKVALNRFRGQQGKKKLLNIVWKLYAKTS